MSDGGLADPRSQLFMRDRLAFDELVHQHIVGLRHGLNQQGAIFLGLLHQVSWNLHLVVLGAQSFVQPDSRRHGDQVHNALELIFGANGELNRYRTSLQAVDDRLDGTIEVRAQRGPSY